MNKKELADMLVAEKIPENAYSLEGGLPNDRYCLSQTHSGWEVYYCERGKKYQEETFISEHEACNRLYYKLKRMLGLD